MGTGPSFKGIYGEPVELTKAWPRCRGQLHPRAHPRAEAKIVKGYQGGDAELQGHTQRQGHHGADRFHQIARNKIPLHGTSGDNYLTHTRGIRSWLLTLDHKRIGVMYLVSILLMFLLGGVFALLVRTELLHAAGKTIIGQDTSTSCSRCTARS